MIYELEIYKSYPKEKRFECIYSKFYSIDKFIEDKYIVEYHPNKKNPEIVYTKSFSRLKSNEERNCKVRKRKTRKV